MNHTLIDHYRCPAEFATLGQSGALPHEKGFFRFGSEAICFGRCAPGSLSDTPTGQLLDAADAVRMNHVALLLPFDLDEVIGNLRYEYYASACPSLSTPAWAQHAAEQAYYSIRPYLGVQLRKHLQRIRLRNWRSLAFPHWPVDRTVETIFRHSLVLLMRSKGVSRIPFIWFWPDGASNAVMLTHDVETRTGLKFCDRLMEEDTRLQLKASFQIVPERRYTVPSQLLRRIQARGFEVNVQDLNHDGRLFTNHQEFLRRARCINEYVKSFGARGFRSAVMYRNADWLHALEIEYDMSFPNVAHLEPQRGGCCTVFPYFIGEVLELPLTTAEDYSLFHVLSDYSNDLWEYQMQLLLDANGLISFVTHPDYLQEKKAFAAYRRLLERIADLRSERKLWVALPGEINDWWRARRQMALVRDGDNWKIEGPGKERTRIAYMTLDGNELTYTIT